MGVKKTKAPNAGGGSKKSLLLLVPLLICDLLLVVGAAKGILQSLGIYPQQGYTQLTLDHYAGVLSDPELVSGIAMSLYVTIFALVASTISAVLLTHFLVSTHHDRGIIFTILKIPMLLPWTVTAFLTMDILGGAGLCVNIANFFGFSSVSDFITNMLYTPNCLGIVVAYIWSTTPFIAYFISPVMSNISDSLGESALMLGASPWQTFVHVTLPLCKESIRDAAILSAVTLFGGYEIPLILGVTSPRLLSVEVYNEYCNLPLSQRPDVMALCVTMMLLSIVLTCIIYLLFTKIGRKPVTAEGVQANA